MIAVRLLPQDEVAERLSQFGCEFIELIPNPQDDYYAYSYWRTSWGFHFSVPLVGPDRLCAEHHLYDVLSELAAQAYDHQNNKR